MLASKTLGALSATPDPSWDVSNAQWLGEGANFFYVGNRDNSPRACFFKPDGTVFYVTGSNSASVHQYSLSTAWDISTSSFLQSKSISQQASVPEGLFLGNNGLKMYVLDAGGDDINEYTLSVAWDVSTATYVRVFSIAAQDATPTGLSFKPDGTKMYIVGTTNDSVFEYDLSTAWDISTATYLQNFSVASQESFPTNLFFKPDGTKMYIVGASGNDVNEYDLSTPWNVTTATFVQVKSISAQETSPTGLFFKDDGTVMYIFGLTSDTVYQYQLSTAWDISTATYSNPTTKCFSVAAQEIAPTGLFFKPDGTKMYIIGFSGDDVNEYDLSTAWAVSTATYLQNFSVSAQELAPNDLFFKGDGTKMYIVGVVGRDVNEYSLSVAWDVSTATFVQLFSVSAQETTPSGIFFKPDGMKMYICGSNGREVNEYNLTTAWDISTATFLQLFSVSAQELAPSGLFFKPDGTKMYVTGQTGEDVNEYDLSTAWDISTATFVQVFSFVGQTVDPTGIFFRDTGLQMYIVSFSSDAIWEYDLV